MKKKVVTKPSSKVTPEQLEIQEIPPFRRPRLSDIDDFLLNETKVKELTAEVAKYHEWCLEWRRLNDALEEELQRTQFMLMDAQAIIVYLENKLGVGV